MSIQIPDSVQDVLLSEIAANADTQSVTSDSSTPTDLTNELASVAMTTGDGNDYTIAQGDAGTGSRKLTMAAKSGVTVDASGTPNHVVLSNSTNSNQIKCITTCSGPDLTSGSTVDFPSWKYELDIPTAA